MIWEMLRTLLFGYPPPPEMIDPRFPEIVSRAGGLSLTVIIAASCLAVGALVGCLLALCRRESSLSGVSFIPRAFLRGLGIAATALVETVRGLPVVLLTLLAFYLPYPLTGIRFPGVILACAAFSLYAGAYFSEIIRSGFRAIPPGLREAGRTLGLTPLKIFMKIELPLVIRNMLPDIVNLAVTIFRDTSILAVAGIAELTYTGRQMMMSQPLNYGLILLITMLLYWIPAALVSSFLTTRSDGGAAFQKSLFLRVKKNCLHN